MSGSDVPTAILAAWPNALLAVCDGAGIAIGGAFLVAPGVACTAAHVVNTALGRDQLAEQQPSEGIPLRFVFLEDMPEVVADVADWRPPGGNGGPGGFDLALLRLRSTPSPQVRALRISPGEVPTGTNVEVFGFPEGNAPGVWARARTAGMKIDGTVQLDSLLGDGYGVRPGFSGMPAWDSSTGCVVGLVVSTERDESVRSSTMVTAGTISRFAGLQQPVGAPFAALTAGLTSTSARVERFLAEYCDSDQKRIPFAGRDEEIATLDGWLEDPEVEKALVLGEAGRGKSALLARWSLGLAESGRASVIFAPISIRFGTADRMAAISIARDRLGQVLSLSTSSTSGTDAWGGEIAQLLREDQPPGPRLLVVIDGIDEAAGWSFENDFPVPLRLGRNVKLIVSARLVAHRDAVEWGRVLGLSADAPAMSLRGLGKSAVLSALASGELGSADWSPETAQALFDVSEGDPLLLRLYIEALRDQGEAAPRLTGEVLKSMEPGLAPFLERWWQDQLQLWESSGTSEDEIHQAQTFLLLCSVAFGPISAQEICSVAAADLPDGLTVRRVADDLRRLILGDDRHGYVFSHPRLREHFRAQAGAASVAQWNHRFVQHGREALAALTAGAEPDDWTYALRHYGAHLHDANAPTDEFGELMQEAWLRAWEDVDPTYDGFVRDLQLTWAHADENHDVVLAVRCALLASSLASMSGTLPADLIALLVRDGLWTQDYAEAYAASVPRPRGRGLALVALAPLLGPDAAMRVVAHRHGIAARDAAALLAGLARVLDPAIVQEIVEEVLARVRAVGDRSEIALVTAILAPVLGSVEQVEVALAGVSEINTAGGQARALQTLAPILDRRQVEDALGRARAIMHMKHRAATLAALGQLAQAHGNEEPLREAVLAARSVMDPIELYETLATVRANAPSAPVPEAFAADVEGFAEEAPAPETAARLYLAAAQLRAPEQREDAIVTAVAVAERVGDPRLRCQLLTRGAELASGERRRVALRAAIAAGRAIGDVLERAELGVALIAADGEDPDGRALPRLDQLGQAAPERRAEALVALAGVLERDRLQQATHELFVEVMQLEDESRKASIVGALAMLLDEEDARRAWSETSYSSAAGRLALGRLAPRIGAAALEGALPAPDLRSSVVESVLQSDPSLANRARAVADRIDNPLHHSRILVAVAIALGPPAGDEAMRRALEEAENVWCADARTVALLEVAQAAEPPLREACAQRLVQQLGRIVDDDIKLRAIARIATDAPTLRHSLLEPAQSLLEDADRATALLSAGYRRAAEKAASASRTAAAQARSHIAMAKEGVGSWTRALAAARKIELEASRAAALAAIAREASVETVPLVLADAAATHDPRERRRVLGCVAARASELDHEALLEAWQEALHGLATRPRPALLGDLLVVTPVLNVLAGDRRAASYEAALDGVGAWLP